VPIKASSTEVNTTLLKKEKPLGETESRKDGKNWGNGFVENSGVFPRLKRKTELLPREVLLQTLASASP